MKKWIYLVISILLLPLVSAEEIMIGGKAYPLIIVFPLILILLVWIIIFGLYIKHNFHNISLVIYNLRRYLRKSGMGKLSEAIKKVPLPKKAPEEEGKKLPAKDLSSHADALSKFEAQLPKLKSDEAFSLFNEITKKFFADLLGMHYEFTNDELVGELQKAKRGLVRFASRIAELKYSGKAATKDEIIDLLDEYKYILETSLRKNKAKNDGIKQGIFSRVIKEDKKIFENVKDYLDFLRREDRKKRIESLLYEEKSRLKDNLRTMRSTYNRILDMYVQLTPQERTKIYPQLMDFYNDVNKAIFSSVYSREGKKRLMEMREELKRLNELPRKIPLGLRIKRRLSKKKDVPAPINKVPTPMKRRASIFSRIMPLFRAEPKASHQLPKGKWRAEIQKKPKAMEDIKNEEMQAVSGIRKVIEGDREASRFRKEMAEELAKIRKGRMAMRREGIQPAISEQRQMQESPAPKPSSEEEELLRKIDSIVNSSQMEKRKDAEIRGVIAKAHQQLDSNKLNEAKRTYESLKPLFSSLPIGKQKEIYPLIQGLQRQVSGKGRQASEGKDALAKEERLLREKMSMLFGR